MIMPDEKAKSATAFLKAAIAYYNSLGVTVAGVETVKGWRRRGRESKLSAVLYVLSVPTWPVDVGERIYAFRRAYEPARAAIVPAHVTLVFGARAISQDELTAHVAEVARRIAPFRVSFSAAEIHEDSISGGYKLFLLTDDGNSYAFDAPPGAIRRRPPSRT